MEEHLPQPGNVQRRGFDRAVTGVVLIVSLLACVMGGMVMRASAKQSTPDTEALEGLDELAARTEQAWAQLPQKDADADESVRDLRTKLHTARMFHKTGHTDEARRLYEEVMSGCESLQDDDE